MSLVDRIRDLLNFDSDKDTTSFEATDAAIDKAKTRNLSTNNFQGRLDPSRRLGNSTRWGGDREVTSSGAKNGLRGLIYHTVAL